MSDASQSRDEISRDALWAIEALETAREPAELGPAFAAAEREKRRLGTFWRIEFIFVVLAGLALALAYAVPSEVQLIARWIALALLVLLIVIRLVVSRNSPRVAALKRVNDALDRWRSLVPAMRELPR
jgi:hypothetical protein